MAINIRLNICSIFPPKLSLKKNWRKTEKLWKISSGKSVKNDYQSRIDIVNEALENLEIKNDKKNCYSLRNIKTVLT